jgi:hypothetical protein
VALPQREARADVIATEVRALVDEVHRAARARRLERTRIYLQHHFNRLQLTGGPSAATCCALHASVVAEKYDDPLAAADDLNDARRSYRGGSRGMPWAG